MEYQTVVNMNMAVPHSSLSRTSSANSFSSEDDASMTSSTASTIIPGARRTRKRFTNAQLTMLENLFHLNSHPSREDREAVAKAGGMEIKSVTIWFQNKRQTERKSAASNAVAAPSNSNSSSRPGSANGNYSSNVVPNITSTLHTFSLHNGAGLARSHSTSGSANSSATSSNSSSRPTLDRVASRTELRSAALNPRTPSRRHNPSLAAWENMPSSPLASPPYSPPSRDLIELNKNAKIRRTLTLEWACEAARIEHKEKDRGRSRDHVHHSSASSRPGPRERSHSTYGKEQRRSSSQSRITSHSRTRTESAPSAPSLARPVGRAATLPNILNAMPPPAPSSISSSSSSRDQMEMEMTDEEEEEAVTPPSTWGKGDSRWDQPTGNNRSMLPPMPKDIAPTSSTRTTVAGLDEDDEMVKAALALCGLGKRGT